VLFSIWVYHFLDIDLVTVLNKVGNTEIGLKIPQWGKILLTAAILASGSEPLHQLIRKFERIGKSKKS
jgi:hypothetical protein